jgi:hypothetical protein
MPNVKAGYGEMNDDERPCFPPAQRRSGKQPWHRRAQETDHEPAEEPLDHHPRMHDPRVKLMHPRKEQRPQRNPGDPDEQRQRKEDPKRFRPTEAEIGRTRRFHSRAHRRAEAAAFVTAPINGSSAQRGLERFTGRIVIGLLFNILNAAFQLHQCCSKSSTDCQGERRRQIVFAQSASADSGWIL